MAAGRADSDFAGGRTCFGPQVIQWLHLISFDETIHASLNTVFVVHRNWTQTHKLETLALESRVCKAESLGWFKARTTLYMIGAPMIQPILRCGPVLDRRRLDLIMAASVAFKKDDNASLS